ncbi:MAG: EAL domain-containing protein [Asticcacaulis sp.]|nr:EAL domain-containing protein [Asticcacaulis sp.]
MSDDYKRQRDRYMAFSLAAADLLIEVGADLKIVRTIGASQALLGHLGDLKGRDISDVFASSDRTFARHLLHRALRAGRIEPCGLHLDQRSGTPLLVNLGACHLPTDDGVYITLTVLSDAMVLTTDSADATGLLGREDFEDMAGRVLDLDADRAPREMRLIRFKGLAGIIRGLPKDQSDQLLSEIGSALRAHSMGGNAAARLSDEEFSYLAPVKGDASTPEVLTQDLTVLTHEVLQAAGVPDDAIRPSVMSFALNTGNLDEDSVARALSFALTTFCHPDNRPPATSLQDSLAQAMDETVQHFDSIRNLIEDKNFTLFYQPVVDLETRKVHHYEALMRFKDGRKVFDTIRLSEQLGLVKDFDLAVTKKALETLQTHDGVIIAVNMSGLSVQDDSFRDSLKQLLAPFRMMNKRLMFELTESSAIEDMDAAGSFLKWLRQQGFGVCLDDFGAGAAAYAYLRRFDVDFVKIDGPFLRDARENPRQRALVRSVSVLCKELRSKVVAEMIEDEETAKLCKALGIEYGQGYLFGKPRAEIIMQKEAPVAARRQGAKESWG